MTDDFNNDFLRRHRLPPGFLDTVEHCYAPVCDWLLRLARGAGTATLVGIGGAQGTGKSTLTEFLAGAMQRSGLHAVALSLDDFYLPREARLRLSRDVHPLLATRGVPGTHDTEWLDACLDALAAVDGSRSVDLPAFDKSTDDRAPASAWRRVAGPVDLVLLEGWCIGARAEPAAALERPVNALERDEDADGRWRRWVNERLATDYSVLFRRLDRLVFLKAPDMDCVYRWRLEQEQKMTGGGSRAMNAEAVRAFVRYFERITRASLRDLPGRADVLIELDRDHGCRQVRFRTSPGGAPPDGSTDTEAH